MLKIKMSVFFQILVPLMFLPNTGFANTQLELSAFFENIAGEWADLELQSGKEKFEVKLEKQGDLIIDTINETYLALNQPVDVTYVTAWEIVRENGVESGLRFYESYEEKEILEVIEFNVTESTPTQLVFEYENAEILEGYKIVMTMTLVNSNTLVYKSESFYQDEYETETTTLTRK